MSDIHIQRSHRLGLSKAREIAWKWAEEVEEKFGMECTVTESDDCDVVDFKRSGVSGKLRVAADGFELNAKLGFLLGAFSRTIETEIEKNLDDLLAKSQPATAKTPAARKGASEPKKSATAAAKKVKSR